MKTMQAAESDRSRFVGLYGLAGSADQLTQKVTPARASIADVMADFAEKQRREGRLGFAQILDLSMLEPVEPYQTTLARLHGSAAN